MKIVCHMSSVHRSLDIRIFHKECVSLARAGYDTHLIINANRDDVKEAARHGVTVHALKYVPEKRRLSRMLFHAFNCYKMAKRLNADLYHLHDPELMPYGLLLVWSGKLVVFDVHEDLAGSIMSKNWIPYFARHVISRLSRNFERFCANYFSAVVAATPYIGALFHGVKARVSIVNNFPIRGELVTESNQEIVIRDSVCYVGGIEETRGIKEIVYAIGMVQCPLLIAGRFGSPELRDKIMKFPGWGYVNEYGFVNRESVTSIMQRSFCGLVTLYPVPNYVNALPIKMFEYMSAGVPVIASDFPLWRKIIEGSECGICVDPKSQEQIANAILYLRDRPDEVVRMGENGRRAIDDLYRWDREEHEMLSLYRKLLFEEDLHDEKELEKYGGVI